MSNEGMLDGLRAILVIPTYGPVDPICQKYVRVAMMTAANAGLKWVGDGSPDKMKFANARNSAAKNLYDGGRDVADGIVWIDSDILLEPNSILSLLHSASAYQEKFVSGVYHQREAPYFPVFYDWARKEGKFRQVKTYPENSFFPMAGCGFGFVWTHFDVIHDIAKHPKFNEDAGWFPDQRDSGGFGEDLSFCHQASNAGYQLYVNTAIQVGHMGSPSIVTYKQYVEELKKNAISE